MNINVKFPINQLSYGLVGVNILNELVKKTNTSLFPIGQINAEQKYHEAIRTGLQNAQMCDYNAPCINLWHQFALAETVGRGPRIGFPIFELTAFNEVEKHHLSNQDRILVTSQWGKEVVEQNISSVPVNVIPLGVDRTVFHENHPKRPNDGKTIFFNCSKIEIRKGHDILPILLKEALGDDSYELWMSWNNPFLTKEEVLEWEQYYRNILGDKVKFIPFVNSNIELAQIMSMVDVGIYLSKAEGWLMNALEMMSVGKPIITTNYSAPTEYCNKDNAYLIDVDILETAYDGKWFHGNCGTWASYEERQKEQARQYIKELHSKKQDSGVLVNEAGLETARRFTWSNTADKIVQAINETMQAT